MNILNRSTFPAIIDFIRAVSSIVNVAVKSGLLRVCEDAPLFEAVFRELLLIGH